MGRFKFLFVFAFFACLFAAVYFVLKSDTAVLVHPKGLMARMELELIQKNLLLMLLVIVPALTFFYIAAWRHRAGAKTKYDPGHSPKKALVVWLFPLIAIIPMAVLTLRATHLLDPYRPITSDRKPLEIQVIAIDWKWLFIYPEEEIATVNVIHIPEKTPIRFHLATDHSPMNSFWIPQLSGQIYAMAGMSTTLHIQADEPGEYVGRAAEINGDGYADMTFVVRAASPSDFDTWVEEVKASPLQLTDEAYEELLKPTMNVPAALYSHVEKGFYHKILMKYMDH